ncbi:paraquat-inducible protein A [bacterium]|nr:paraquat-inducible protein A [bacterium]
MQMQEESPEAVTLSRPTKLRRAFTALGEERFLAELIPLKDRAAYHHALTIDGVSSNGRAKIITALKERQYEGPIRFLMVLLVFASTGLFAIALNLPFFQVEKFWLFKNNVSVIDGLGELWSGGEYFLFFAILIFTIVFPIAKLVVLLYAATMYEYIGKKGKSMVWAVGELGRFSMLDVFIVTILVVLVKASAIVTIHIGVGIYVFTGAVVCMQLMSLYLQHVLDKCTEDIHKRSKEIDRVLEDVELEPHERALLLAA